MLTFDPTFNLGNLLTSASVLIALAGFLYSFSKDRTIRRREYADRVRSSAANALSKLDRCQSLLAYFFDLVQMPITEADELSVASKNAVQTRDFFWKKANEVRGQVLAEFSKEQLEVAYAPLLTYRPEIYDMFRAAIGSVRSVEEKLFDSFQDGCQQAILNAPKQHSSALLGNMLRKVCDAHQKEFDIQSTAVLVSMRKFLRNLIASEDIEIL